MFPTQDWGYIFYQGDAKTTTRDPPNTDKYKSECGLFTPRVFLDSNRLRKWSEMSPVVPMDAQERCERSLSPVAL